MSWAPELPGGRPGHNWAWGPGGGRRVTRTLRGRRSRSPADFPTSEAHDREASSVCSRRRGTGPAARLRDSGNFLGRGQRGRGTGARRFPARPRALGRQRGPRSAWGRVEVGIGRKVLSRNHAGPSVGGPLTPLGPSLLIQNFLSAAGVNRSFQPERGASM